MKNVIYKIFILLLMLTNSIFAQSVFFNRVRVINMIPQQLSGESNNDSEPSIGVNPRNTRIICASAFTPNPDGDIDTAPIFITEDGGTTWTLNNIVPSGNRSTGDISVKFNSIGDRLYAGILKGGSSYLLNVLETENPLENTLMSELFNHENVDQPFIQARTLSGSTIEDKLFIGSNMGSNNTSSTIHTTQNARVATPTFDNISIDSRSGKKDRPSIRPSVHSDGTVYAVFVAAVESDPSILSNIVVVRDDDWGRNNYLDLIDPSDSKAGFKVATNISVPRATRDCPNTDNISCLGAERISSRLSIAVHPNNSDIVYLAYGNIVNSVFTLHIIVSKDRGVTWSNDLLTIQNATNPSLAVTPSGIIGFSYQQLKTNATTNRWETHFRGSKGNTEWSDLILSDFQETIGGGLPYLGDYADLMAVGETFYGIFSAKNFPDLRNFPQGVTYQREVDFTTNRLLDLDGSVVRESTDPFFFTVSNEICNPRKQPCFSTLWDCRTPKLEPGKIVIDKCLLHPCIVVDPVPQNCLIKFDCPGCSKTTLCAPYHHIYLEDFDTNVWSADISTFKNEDVNYTINKINNGIVISFKPSEKNFRQKDIGDYNLTFQSLSKKVVNKKYTFKTKLEVSDYPFSEHIKHR